MDGAKHEIRLYGVVEPNTGFRLPMTIIEDAASIISVEAVSGGVHSRFAPYAPVGASDPLPGLRAADAPASTDPTPTPASNDPTARPSGSPTSPPPPPPEPPATLDPTTPGNVTPAPGTDPSDEGTTSASSTRSTARSS